MTRRQVRASLLLLRSDQGGRRSPILSGYRSLVRFKGTERDFGFELDLDSESLAPGERGTGTLSFWAVADLPDISEGQEFEIREGARIVGCGDVLEPTALDPGEESGTR